jgi:hypothetical protein
MLASYGSRDGVLQALSVLTAQPLPNELREQVIEDTLAGAPLRPSEPGPTAE